MAISTPHRFSVVFDDALRQPLMLSGGPRPSPIPPVSTFTVFNGTAGNDNFTGGAAADTFNMADGGKDTVTGRNGADIFNFGAQLTATDTIDGGGGDDTLNLDGDYSDMLILGAATLRSVETIWLVAGHDYSITLDNSNVILGGSMMIDGSSLIGDSIVIDGSDETSSSLTILGGTGSDTLVGGGADDVFASGGGGADTINGGAGDDTIFGFFDFSASDRINGGEGKDTLSLDGDYLALGALAANTLRDIEIITLAGGNDYDFALHGSNLDFGERLTINGSAQGGGDKLVLDASAITEGTLRIIGGAQLVQVTVGTADQVIVKGGGGTEIINALGHLDPHWRIDGGFGSDQLTLDGNYLNLFTFEANTIKAIEALNLLGPHTYNFRMNDGNVEAGQTLSIFTAPDSFLTLDASAENLGRFTVTCGGTNSGCAVTGANGADTIYGGSLGNAFFAELGGDDTFIGGAGSDACFFGAAFDAFDTVDPGLGTDSLHLDGNYGGGVLIPNFEQVFLAGGHSYDLTAVLPGGMTMTVTAESSADTSLDFDGTGSSGNFVVLGSSGADHLTGGSGQDTLDGGASGGNDRFEGGLGADLINLNPFTGGNVVTYTTAAESSSTTYDTVQDLWAVGDFIDVPFAVTLDATIAAGTLSTATFDANLAAAVGALGVHHAVIFKPNAGTLSGRAFLVIEANSSAGYQANQDYAIDITGYDGGDSLDFI